jgi:hypothetical protein
MNATRRLLHSDPATFERRVLLDAFLDADKTYWLSRAAAFEAARPTPGDYTGRATAEEVRARWDALTDAAEACRHRAALAEAALTTFAETHSDLESHKEGS